MIAIAKNTGKNKLEQAGFKDFTEGESVLPSISFGAKSRFSKNWKILPPGIYPWKRIRQELEEIVMQAPRGNQNLIWDRLQHISLNNPSFLAIGEGRFRGYFVLAFPDKNLFVLESLACNNATYVLGDSWEKLSKLTKAEILNAGLHKARLIHRRGWHQLIHQLLKQT